MKHVSRLALMVGLVSSTAGAQEFQRGETFILRVPLAASHEEKGSFGSTVLSMTLAKSRSGSLLVAGDSTWANVGFPSSEVFRIGDVRDDKKTGLKTVSLSPVEFGGTSVRVIVPIADTLGQLLRLASAPPADSTTLIEAAIVRFADRVFAPPLSALPATQRQALVRAVRSWDGTPVFPIVEFRDAKYVTINLGLTDSYNDARLSANQRAAKVITDRLLTIAKHVEILLRNSGQSNVMFDLVVPHRNFVLGPVTSDHWKVYMPLASIKKFADADITSQDLIDASFVLIDGNRTKVVLSDG
jgi:hypothetical protein